MVRKCTIPVWSVICLIIDGRWPTTQTPTIMLLKLNAESEEEDVATASMVSRKTSQEGPTRKDSIARNTLLKKTSRSMIAIVKVALQTTISTNELISLTIQTTETQTQMLNKTQTLQEVMTQTLTLVPAQKPRQPRWEKRRGREPRRKKWKREQIRTNEKKKRKQKSNRNRFNTLTTKKLLKMKN